MSHYRMSWSCKRGSFGLKSLVAQKCVVTSRVSYKTSVVFDAGFHYEVWICQEPCIASPFIILVRGFARFFPTRLGSCHILDNLHIR